MADTSNTADIIDSRDIIARIEELEEQEERDADEAIELASLRKVAEQAEGYASDWKYGEALIRGSYFETYAQELAEDCCDMKVLQWPARCIDWEQAARELQMDYTAIDYDGVTYWIR
jgi:hypothetical protein